MNHRVDCILPAGPHCGIGLQITHQVVENKTDRSPTRFFPLFFFFSFVLYLNFYLFGFSFCRLVAWWMQFVWPSIPPHSSSSLFFDILYTSWLPIRSNIWIHQKPSSLNLKNKEPRRGGIRVNPAFPPIIVWAGKRQCKPRCIWFWSIDWFLCPSGGFVE